MNLIFLHGAPATGKLTVARTLAQRTGYRLFHNHLVVDTALALYDFGSPGFVALRERLWRDAFAQLAADRPAGVIFTFNPENTVSQDFLDWLFRDWPVAGLRLLSVGLTASPAAIERRLVDASRRDYRKLTDLDLYRRLQAAGAFATPLIPRTDLSVDTEAHAPDEAAALIARHFGLPGS